MGEWIMIGFVVLMAALALLAAKLKNQEQVPHKFKLELYDKYIRDFESKYPYKPSRGDEEFCWNLVEATCYSEWRKQND